MTRHRVLVQSGAHRRRCVPLSIPLPEPCDEGRLVDESSGSQVPCQVQDGALWFLLEKLDPQKTAQFTFEAGRTPAPTRSGVRMRHRKRAHEIDVRIGSKLFTTYHFAPGLPRPFLHPVHGPRGIALTRGFPMEPGEGETRDHPHHRSLWVAHGDVNGSDNWTEMPDHGTQVARGGPLVVEGPVFGRMTQDLDWLNKAGEAVVAETRQYQFYACRGPRRLMDLTVRFQARSGAPVRFGDTKEGGICAVRVATTMDGSRGGRIENSIGGVGEAECWGRPAHWVDYSGTAGGRQMGIAIFDHPQNLRHPTPWHVRNYGLFAANPFALHDYDQGLAEDGSHTLAAGESLVFRYRLLLHTRDARGARVADHYHGYVNPPSVEVS